MSLFLCRRNLFFSSSLDRNKDTKNCVRFSKPQLFMCLFLCSKNMLFEERGQKIAVLKTAIPGVMSITEKKLCT